MDRQTDRNDSLVSWMIAGGARLEEPDNRRLLHLVAIRDAARDASLGSPFARLAAWFGPRSAVAAGAAPGDVTTCCAPA